METLIIDGMRCENREQLHEMLSQSPLFPPYYGRNLDALHDVLSACATPLLIRVLSPDVVVRHLGRYGEIMLMLLRDAASENPKITLEMMGEAT